MMSRRRSMTTKRTHLPRCTSRYCTRSMLSTILPTAWRTLFRSPSRTLSMLRSLRFIGFSSFILYLYFMTFCTVLERC
ncbi:hypothetical protein BDR04DRAFT_225839 [Suillus decipiens]|nr:hypothetical protein BDR04DRAFT_225839 [Suillus decipiens]